MDWLFYENKYNENGRKTVCGVDEAGRGPLAGPVYAAAVVLPAGLVIPGVNDSKKLTERKREELFKVICEKALSYSVSYASEQEIDDMNILNATYKAMTKAVEGLEISPDFVLVDGNRLPPWNFSAEAIVKGDALSQSIACASILAKVSRDEFMLKQSEIFPEYAFEKHKGYGTKLHTEKIKKYGPCPLHRKTFLRKILSK